MCVEAATTVVNLLSIVFGRREQIMVPGPSSDGDSKTLCADLFRNPELAPLLPSFVHTSRDLAQFFCTHMLDELIYDSKAELPRLYGLVADELSLAPDSSIKQTFRSWAGGCCTVVQRH